MKAVRQLLALVALALAATTASAQFVKGNEAVKVMRVLGEAFEFEFAEVGGAAFAAHGHPLPEATLRLAQAADAGLPLMISRG